MTRPITLLVCALGGEGGGVLARWLYEAAVRAGHAAQASSIPGVAQRTGATTYWIEISPQPLAAMPEPPVFALAPVPGCVDLLVSSELLETLRQTALGMVSPDRTQVLSSIARALTVLERIPPGDGRLDSEALVAALGHHAKGVQLLDFGAMAGEAGTVVSSAMFGAIAASGVLPWPRALFEATIADAGKAGAQASLRGFALAFDAVSLRQRQQAVMSTAPAPADRPAPPDLRALARSRLLDYQDEAYVRLFDERLARIQAAEAAAPSARSGEIVRETARWLALWMAFDDIVRVAQLKLAAGRMARVRREVGAGEGEVLKVYDHFKPGVAEAASLLPEGLAARLEAWDRRRVAAGHEPWAWPIRLASHGIRGALTLRLLASLRGLRRRGRRYQQEQALIERWLAAIEAAAREDAALGLELASCGRLVKGYGSTNERGKERLLHVIDHLAQAPASTSARAAAIRALREAALADESGKAFDEALVQHGALPRVPKPQPIRWYKRKPQQPARA